MTGGCRKGRSNIGCGRDSGLRPGCSVQGEGRISATHCQALTVLDVNRSCISFSSTLLSRAVAMAFSRRGQVPVASATVCEEDKG